MLGSSVDVFDAFACTMVRNTHDFVVFVVLWLVIGGIYGTGISDISLDIVVCKMHHLCFHFWFAFIVIENVFIDDNIFILLIVFNKECEIVPHMKRIDTEWVFFIATSFLNHIVEEKLVARARQGMLIDVVGVRVSEIEW